MAMVSSTPGSAQEIQGILEPMVFDKQIILWRSVDDLEKASLIVASGTVKDGDFDQLLECWVDPGTPATVIKSLSEGQLLRVRLDTDYCEGVIFAEEFKQIQ
jgi:hypothetical protein